VSRRNLADLGADISVDLLSVGGASYGALGREETMLARFGVFEWSMVAIVVLGIAAGVFGIVFHLY
jgi:hypothetical protein